MNSKKLIIIFALFFVVASASAFPLSPSDTEIQNAINYLQAQQSSNGDIGGFATSSWAVMALESAGVDSTSFGSHSKSSSS